jgi:hypothetical protein
VLLAPAKGTAGADSPAGGGCQRARPASFGVRQEMLVLHLVAGGRLAAHNQCLPYDLVSNCCIDDMPCRCSMELSCYDSLNEWIYPVLKPRCLLKCIAYLLVAKLIECKTWNSMLLVLRILTGLFLVGLIVLLCHRF